MIFAKKKVFVAFACFLFLSLLLVSFVHSADLSSGLDSAQSGLEKVKEGVETAKDIKEDIETARADYLLEKWKGFFLKIPAIAAIDSSLQKISIVFLILFSKSYSLSLSLFIAMTLWILTALALSSGISSFFSLSELWQKALAGIAAAVIIAWLQIFNLLSNLAVKAIFYPSRWYWSIISFIVIIFAIFVYYQLCVILGGYLEKKKKSQKEAETQFKIKKQEAKMNEIEKALK